MEEDNYYINSNISSFLLECLVWNCPNKIFNDIYGWNNIIRSAIIFLYNNTKSEGDEYTKWGEVSDLLYLFHNDRKWSRRDVNTYLLNMWNYMEY